MVKLASRVIPNYNLYQRSGFPESIAIPQIDAARQIVGDIERSGLLIRFVEVLIDVHENGEMGRKIPISLLPQLIKEIESMGYGYRIEGGIFIESGAVVKTKGWGVLREGLFYDFSFLRVDIVGNTELVRLYPEKQISRIYNDLQELFSRLVENREGRIWSWEGDGGLAAFYFSNKNIDATICGIEVLLELFLYNLLERPIKKPIAVRAAVHTGQCRFLNNTEQIESETLKRVNLIESQQTEPDSLSISPGVYSDLGGKLANLFQPFEISSQNFLYKCRLGWE
jgi:class 3 adenylate cyclase